MSEKRFTIHKENMYKEDWYDYPFCIKEDGEVVLETIPLFIAEKVRDKLNEQEQEIQRWKTLYEIKDKEVTARVDTLNRVCNYYLTEVQFKADTDPNEAVKEVINEILNTPIYKE